MTNTELLFPAEYPAEKIIAREEKRFRDEIAAAAEQALKEGARFVFLAGPSCSGKTTTSLNLIAALEQAGKRVLTFSTDDFFFDESHAERFADGTPDYDAFSHTDSDYIRLVLKQLARGEQAILPTFDFLHGRRGKETVTVEPDSYDIFILEGIHALNDRILSALPNEEKRLCLYLNTNHGIRMDGETDGLSPREVRFCRRVIRDYKHRAANAERSFSLWTHVIEAEEEILLPFRKNADLVLSSDFSYEPAVAKAEVSDLLTRVRRDSPFYEPAEALLKKLKPFPAWSEDLVPKDSVLQEFLAD